MLHKILTSVFALEANYHDRLSELIMGRLAHGKEAVWTGNTPKLGFPTTVAVSGKVDGLNVAGNVRVIGIDGVMSRNGDYCSFGTEDMSRWIREANADDSISSILLKINSGGGDVDGTEQLADCIRTSKKPVVAFIAATGASAAYWVASACKEIIMETETTAFVGSIGVLSMHVDASKAMEDAGMKVTIIRADGSEDKAAYNSYEPLTEQVVAETKAVLTSIRTTFVANVKANRPKVKDSVFNAKMYDGKAALANGLADRIGGIEYATKRAMFHARKAELRQAASTGSVTRASTAPPQPSPAGRELSLNQISNNNMYPKLSAALGGEIPAEISEESCVVIETVLSAYETDLATATAALTDAQAVATVNETRAASELATANAATAEVQIRLAAFEAGGLSVAEIPVVKAWYESQKAGGTPPAGDIGKGGEKVNCPITQRAIEIQALRQAQ